LQVAGGRLPSKQGCSPYGWMKPASDLITPTVHDGVAALNRFGRLFFEKLWDVYAREFLEYGPI
jgi:hypothetical protein